MTRINLSTLFTTPFGSSVSNQSVNFRGSEYGYVFRLDGAEFGDRFNTNPLYSVLGDETTIMQKAKSNSKIMQLLNSKGLSLQVDMKTLDALKRGHLYNTRILAAKIASNLK